MRYAAAGATNQTALGDGAEPKERLPERSRAARLAIAGLSLFGVADALYMLAYDEGLIDSLVCPFFGEGCNVVGRSAHARHFGVPNAAVGAVGYAAMGALALWAGDHPAARRPLPLLGLVGVSLAAGASSVFLTWEQWARVRAWCFWCLLSAGINLLLLLPLAIAEAWPLATHRGRTRTATAPRSGGPL